MRLAGRMAFARRLFGRGAGLAPTTADVEMDALGPADRSIVEHSLPFTMTGVARLQALVEAVRYCERRRLEGAFAECGVWRGGSVLAMILTLQDAGARPRDLFLFDTFEGMTAPSDSDVSPVDPPALETWREARLGGKRAWSELFDPAVFNEESVRKLLFETGYPQPHMHFIRGPVEETLPSAAPEQIALLRLDTDWYESTRHELEHLYPRLVPGGVLIIDDYGHWQGCRRAVDEYFAERPPLLLHRIDYTARIAVKS
jgi:O-methyltransferase